MTGVKVKRNELLGENEEALCLFYSQVLNLENIYTHLRTLMVYGVKLTSLRGLDLLTELEELWIVDCGIQTAEEISKCINVKKLYLFSNSLTDIPDCRFMNGLHTIWLSKNKIKNLKNLHLLPSVEHLHICDNLIVQLDHRLHNKLHTLNLSGNPIENLKTIETISSLKSLKHLILRDEMYNTCHVALLTNYRAFVIYCLPHIESLDSLKVTEQERNATTEFFASKLLYYNVVCHSLLNQIQNCWWKRLSDEHEVLNIIRSGLYIHSQYSKENNFADETNDNQSKYQYWQAELSRWNARYKQLQKSLQSYNQIIKEQTEFELKHVGNIRFTNVKHNSNEFKCLDKMVNNLLCPYANKEACIDRISLDRVIQIDCNNEYSLNHTSFYKTLATLDTKKLFLLCQPYPIKNISEWSLSYIEQYFFDTTKLDTQHTVTNCIVLADSQLNDSKQIHYKLLIRSECLNISKFGIIVGVDVDKHQLSTEIHDLHKFVHKKLHSDAKDCLTHTSKNMHEIVPLFIVEFSYVFKDLYKLSETNHVKHEKTECKSLLGFITILQVKTKLEYITSVEFPYSNITALDQIPKMENVLVVDLSYNHIEDISNIADIFPGLTVLNLSFNNIRSLGHLKDMTSLKTLYLQWNKIQEFLPSVMKLKSVRCLRHLDMSYNLYKDVIHDSITSYFICKYLPSLETFNGSTLQRVYCNNNFVLKDFVQLPIFFQPSNRFLTTNWKSEFCLSDESENETVNHIAENENKLIICVSIIGKNINQFRSILPVEQVKWLNLSNNLISSVGFLKKMPLLEEINLSNNVLEKFDCSQDILIKLIKLDLSYNYLISLKEFRSAHFPNLKILDISFNILTSLHGAESLTSLSEFYGSYNKISNLDAVLSTKEWKQIRVLDLSNNPIAEHPLFRKFCIFNLKTIEFINGQEILAEELENAEHLFGGWLDQDYLNKKFAQDELDHITQLTLANCSINKVHLQKPMTKVQSINMENNKITTLNWLCWFPKAITVCLSYNSICCYSDVPTEHNQMNNSLQSLFLDNNGIKSLVPLRFHLFPNLQSLFLQENEIVNLQGMNHLSQLNNLILDHNKISKINENEINRLVKLRQLYLEYNNLMDLKFLKAVPCLHSLFLSHNKIIDKKQFERLKYLKDLKEICMQGNPLFRNEQLYRDLLSAVPNVTRVEGYVLETSEDNEKNKTTTCT